MRRSLSRCTPLALGGCALALALGAPIAARGETYGELGRFGSAGIAHGQFKLTSGTHAFGADPTDNSVYVGDEPKKGEYRIQKLTASGSFLAETTPFKPPNHGGLEGIAVDPVDKRVYALALETRGATLKIDAGKPAAGTLYAFSSEQSGEELVPASGTSGGVLTGPEAFAAQSDVPETALLNPRGIAVDPTTHDVIVLGEVDAGEVKNEPQLHVALQRVHANGALGARYLDGSEFFVGLTPNSPVVSPTGAVYVAVPQARLVQMLGEPPFEASADELAQIPSDFASTAPPTPFVQFVIHGPSPDEEHGVVEFDENETAKSGGGLSLASGDGPGEPESTIYAKAHIFNGNSFFPGVLAFDGANGAELGWTGGQTKQTGSESCTIGIAGPTYPSVAAGKDRTVFMLDPKSTRVVRFGPEGGGCPPAQASEPEATINGQPLLPSETVSAGTAVTFSSTMTLANALRVEWSFGDGQTQTDDTDEYRHAEVTHKFVRGGELTVTETIHTDNLATPTIVTQTKISVSATAPPPTAVLEGPAEVILGGGGVLGRLVYLEGGGLGVEETTPSEEATFDASASYASTATGANRIDTYHWVFGDGESATTEADTVKHLYRKAGAYRVELTVTDALGSTSEPSVITVRVVEPPPRAPGGGGPIEGVTSVPAAQAPAGTGAGSGPPATSGRAPLAVPDVRLKNNSLSVSPSGTVELDVSCPAEESGGCAGTVTLRTLSAVTSGASNTIKRHGAKVLTLAAGRFAITGGRVQAIRLRLSAHARTLLARTTALRARATIVAHDLAGATHTTQTVVTLHAPRAGVRMHTRHGGR